MTHELRWRDRVIPYAIRKNRRARHLRLTVHHDGRVSVTLPWRVPVEAAPRFVSHKAAWLVRTVDKIASRPRSLLHTGTRQDYLRHKKEALRIATERLHHFNQHYGFSFKRISIRNQSTRWGSCSRTGNLSFNYRLVMLSPELRDYLIVHELCHLKAFNHSPTFWNLVGETVPDYCELRKRLRAGLG